MRDVIDAMPIVRAYRALTGKHAGGDKLAASLFAVICFYVAIALLTPLSERVQRSMMAAHHYRPHSLLEWALIQPAPKMYSFAHQCWIGPIPLFDRPRDFAERAFERTSFWVNHYPARKARFDGMRGELYAPFPDRVIYVYLRTRYRGTELGSGYAVSAEDGQLVLRPLEATP